VGPIPVNTEIGKLRQEDHDFENSLGYIVISRQKKTLCISKNKLINLAKMMPSSNPRPSLM
jgi:hypothetical protein